MKRNDKSRRSFVRTSAIAAGGMMASGALTASGFSKAKNLTSSSRPFIGVQLDKTAFENRSFPELFDENVETPEFIAECTCACFREGADGIILSRHYSEMKQELVKAGGEVIREHFKLN